MKGRDGGRAEGRDGGQAEGRDASPPRARGGRGTLPSERPRALEYTETTQLHGFAAEMYCPEVECPR